MRENIKGQHLAVETIITFMMGITVAMGVITIFNQYVEDVKGSAKAQESSITASKVENSVYILQNSDSGKLETSLPESIGGESYTVSVDQKIEVSTITSNYSKAINTEGEFRGLSKGGDTVITKNQNIYRLRSD